MNHIGKTALIALSTLLFACSKTVYVPLHTVETVTLRDTTTIHHTDTLVKVPEFRLSDYASLTDTLVLEASNARATAWVDSSLLVIKGRLTQTGSVQAKFQWKERTVYRDSIVYEDKPVPVEVVKEVKYTPWLVKVLAWVGGIGILGAVVWLLRKFGIL